MAPKSKLSKRKAARGTPVLTAGSGTASASKSSKSKRVKKVCCLCGVDLLDRHDTSGEGQVQARDQSRGSPGPGPLRPSPGLACLAT